MTRCCVPYCGEIGHHLFPKDIKLRRLWLKAIRRQNFEPTNYSRLCGKHFVGDDYQIVSKKTGVEHQHKYLKKGVVPSVFPWIKPTTAQAEERLNRLKKRNARKSLLEPLTLTQNNSQNITSENVADVIEISTIKESETYNFLEASSSIQTKSTQTSNIMRLFSTETLLSDDETVRYYTGLESISKFNLVMSTLLPMANHIKYRWRKVLRLSIKDQFLILLIKLKHNRPDFELSKMFGISKTEVSNIVVTWINFVYDLWSLIDIWPNKELVNFYMPDSFKQKYGSTRIIIDGTEIPIQKPSQPDSQKATFSSYKHKNTLKFLVGATPGSLMCYCSGAFAGSVSDRQIIERSNLLQLCEKGDTIMADRGFNVQDIFASKGIGINIPTFLKGKSQIPSVLLKEDQCLASQRVHIERLIGLTKTYKILTNELNQFYIPLATRIFYICMMLCNFRECIVNKNK